MKGLPEGIVTFLFTDVEGSTRLAKELGDKTWAELLEEHRRILRDAFFAHAGREVDTQGDAFFMVFLRASDAVTAAIEAQRTLEDHPWPSGGRVRVRLGIHTGEALARGDHYVGQEVHRASRICNAGHGGQIVVSQTTADLVRESLPTDATFIDLGQHRLKDFGDAQRLFQLGAMGLPSEFPRLRSLDAPHNLPAERSSFVGREKEVTAIRRLLAERRLVTLTGIGGSGKTRLALQVGALELGSFPDGVFFVDLAPISDPDLVAQTTATACGMSLGDALGTASGSVDDQLVAALARRKCLLLVDNCEHLLHRVADLVDQILASCPHVVFLTTSRETLGVEGEQIVQVPSLEVPDDPAEADVTEAVRLFVARAQLVKPAFELGSAHRAPVAEICRRLDGIPLAIELAAARVAHLSPQQIAERLEDMFRLLTGGHRRIKRQQTLAAALDWSHDLLDEGEQMLFRRLAVFAGGFSLDAAEAVCVGDDVSAASLLDLLASLVAKSLVITADNDGVARYRLLETVRMYALEKLAAAGEGETVRSRHRDWYLGWVEAISFERLAFTAAGFRAIAREIDNLRTAADWCVGNDRPDLLARLVTRLYSFWGWHTGSAAQEGRRRTLQALRQDARLSREERVACHAVHGSTALSELQTELPMQEATRAIDLAEGRPSPFLVIAFSIRAFANSALATFPGADPRIAAEARRDAEAAVAASRSSVPAEWRAYAEWNAWMMETNLGNARAAAERAAACAEACSVAEDPGWLHPMPYLGLAVSHHLLGDTDEALRAAIRFRTLANLPDSPAMARTLAIDATPALVAGGEDEQACQVLREAARTVRRLGTPLAENHLLGIMAVVEHLRGRPERAGRLLGASRHLGGAVNLPIPFRTPGSMSFYRHYRPLIRAALGPDEARRARDEGRAMTFDDAIGYALEGLG